MRIEEDDDFFPTVGAAVCKSSNEGSGGFHMNMTITIIAIAFKHVERRCQRGPAGECQNNVGGGENKHYRGRDEKNGTIVRSGEGWVVKIKSKWLYFMKYEQSCIGRDRERSDSPTSVTSSRGAKLQGN